MTPEDLAALKARLTNQTAKPKPAPEPEPPMDPMAAFEADMAIPRHQLVDPLHLTDEVTHLQALYPDPRDLGMLLRTYRGRMTVNALLYDPALSCEGCRARVRSWLAHPVSISEMN